MSNNIQAEINVVSVRRINSEGRLNRDFGKKARIYFWHEDESILENFGNRVSRPVDVYRKFLPQVAVALGLPEDTKFRWSQYAGCSCPCSPGFICKEVVSKDVHVELKNAPLVDEGKEAVVMDRKVQLAEQLDLEDAIAAQVKAVAQAEADYTDQLMYLLSR
jgi:hypothetical protein